MLPNNCILTFQALKESSKPDIPDVDEVDHPGGRPLRHHHRSQRSHHPADSSVLPGINVINLFTDVIYKCL